MRMERNIISKISSVLLTLFFVTACGTTDTEDSSEASSDMRTQTPTAVVTPTGEEGGLTTESMVKDEPVYVPLKTVFYFDFDQSALKPETRASLDAQIAHLLQSSGIVRLEGHADDRGTREYNLALGERRAKAVENYMALQGISRARIETISYGEEKPVAFGENEESWSLNRRVQIR